MTGRINLFCLTLRSDWLNKTGNFFNSACPQAKQYDYTVITSRPQPTTYAPHPFENLYESLAKNKYHRGTTTEPPTTKGDDGKDVAGTKGGDGKDVADRKGGRFSNNGFENNNFDGGANFFDDFTPFDSPQSRKNNQFDDDGGGEQEENVRGLYRGPRRQRQRRRRKRPQNGYRYVIRQI
jgi:hypothetical protein